MFAFRFCFYQIQVFKESFGETFWEFEDLLESPM